MGLLGGGGGGGGELSDNTREITCDEEKEEIKERTEERDLSGIFLMILHLYPMLNYFINYPATKNWEEFNK